MIKAVFIDIDDTLLSFSGYVKEAMRDGFAQFGLKPYAEDMFPVFERINNGLWRQIEQGTLTREELMRVRWNRIFAALGIDFDGETFEDYFREKLFYSAVPEPGAQALLDHLAGRYVLCAASNGPYEQQVNRLRVAGMYEAFAHCFISWRIGAQKPSREFFDHCFEALRRAECPGLRPEEAIIIGDSLSSDIAGGAAYGMHTCLYRRQPGPEAAGADHVVRRLEDIASFL